MQAPQLEIQYGTYFGGASVDKAFDLTLAANGSVYLTGWTTSSDLPTRNAHQPRYAGNWDAFVARLDCAGSQMVFSTYLGGTGEDNQFANGISVAAGGGIAVDRDGNAYITGRTTSDDFPVLNAAQGRRSGGVDTFVAKLSATGTLLYSTYFGGSADDEGWGIAVDERGHAFVIGKTQSGDIPVANALNSALSGRSDAFIAEFDQAGVLVFASYLGGTGEEFASSLSGASVSVDRQGFVYFVGDTDSSNFPVTPTAYQGRYQGAWDVFAVKFDPRTSRVIYSSYIGGSSADNARGAAVDSAGNLYVTGHTSGAFPVTSGAYETRHRGMNDAFLVKLSGNGDRIEYATYIGGARADVGMDVAVDSNGIATVVGFTESADFPLVRPLPMRLAGPRDGFIAQFSASGSVLQFGSYFGGSDNDVGYAVAGAAAGAIHVAARTSSTDWPIPSQAVQSRPGGAQDAYIARLGPAGAAPSCRPGDGVLSSVSSITVTCSPLLIGYACTARAEGDGASQDVTQSAAWNTSDGELATVDQKGVVTPVASGRIEVTATLMGTTGKALVDVHQVSFVFDDSVTALDRQLVRDTVLATQKYFEARFGRVVTLPASVVVRDQVGGNPAFASNGNININVRHPVWTGTTTNLKRKIIAHEWFHLLQSQVQWGTTPQWLLEGAAEFVGFRAVIDGGLLDETGVRDCHVFNVSTQALPSLSSFENNLLSSVPGSTYSLAWLAVDFATRSERPGLQAIKRYWEAVPMNDWRSAFMTTFRLRDSEFYLEFEEYRRRLTPPAGGGSTCLR